MTTPRLLAIAAIVGGLVFTPLQSARSAADPYDINVMLTLTGPGTFLGTAQRASLEVLQDVENKAGGIKGRPVRFVYFDDQTVPHVAVQLANSLIAKNVPVVLGSDLAVTCHAIAPLFKDGPVNYCFSPSIYPEPGSYVFSSSVSTKDLLIGQLRYYHARGLKKLARLTTTDASGQDADANIPIMLATPEFKDMSIVADEHYNPSDTSVGAQIAKIKATNPQALLIWAPGTAFGTALVSVKDAGLDIPIATSEANMSVAQMKQYSGMVPKELYFQGVGHVGGMGRNAQSKKAVNAFVRAIKEHGISNDAQAGLAWDPAAIVIDGLRALGTTATAAQLKAWIANQTNYGGISGVYDFKHRGQHGLSENDVIIVRWDAEKAAFVPVSKFGGSI